MAGIVGVKYKIMPSSVETDLEKMKQEITQFLESKDANNIKISEEPVAFGLKALIIFFQFDEDQGTDHLEDPLKNIENVQSIQMTDIRKIA